MWPGGFYGFIYIAMQQRGRTNKGDFSAARAIPSAVTVASKVRPDKGREDTNCQIRR